MWNRLPSVNLKQVAGNIRSTVSQFADEVQRQAQSLAEEEEDGDHLPGDDTRPSSTLTTPPGSTFTSPPPTTASARASPAVSSRITALKARLEEEKNRAKQTTSRSDGEVGREGAAEGKIPSRENDVAQAYHRPSRGEHETPQFTQPRRPAQEEEPHQTAWHTNPSYGASHGSSQETSPEERGHTTARLHHGNATWRTDDFVDVPLNSPDGLVRPPNGSAAAVQSTGGASLKAIAPKERAADQGMAQLKDQLQRLKGELVRGSMAHEEEQSRLQQEFESQLAERESEVAGLREQLQAHIIAREQSRGMLSVEQSKADVEKAVQAARAEALEQHLHAEQQWRQQMAEKDSQLQIIRQELEASAQRRAAGADGQQARIAQLEEDLQQLRAAQALKANDEASLEALRQEVAHLQDALAAQELRAESVEAELAAEREAHDNTCRDAEAAMLEVEALRQSGANDASAAREDFWRQEVEAVNVAKQAAEADAAEVRSKLQKTQAAAEQAMTSLAERDAFWTTEVQQVRSQLSTCQQELKAAREQIRQQEQELTALQAEQRRQARELQAAEASSQAARSEFEAAEQKLFAARQELESSRAAGLEAEAASQQLQRRIVSLESDVASLTDEASQRDLFWKQELERQHAQSMQQEAELREQLQRHAEAETSAQEQLDLSRKELQKQAEAHRRLHQREEDLQLQLQAAVAVSQSETQRDHWQQELSKRDRDNQGLQAELEKAQRHLDSQAHLLETAELRAAELSRSVDALTDDLTAERESSASLRQDLEEMAGSLRRAESRAAASIPDARQSEQLERQLLSSQAECSALQAEVKKLRAALPQSGELQNGGPAVEEAASLQEALSRAESERDRAKQQLSRLKQQMVASQDEEDDKLSWRVEAEVQAAISEVKAQAEAQRTAWETREAELNSQLATAQSQLQNLQSALSAWEAAVAERDVEIQTLQGALGELTYESEAAERLRSEIRTERSRAEALRIQLSQAQAAQKDADAAKEAAQAEAEHRLRDIDAGRERQQQLAEEASMLRRAVHESMKRINMLNSDSGAMVDRRIVVKLLVTYFQRGQSPEILDLMSRMLGLTDDDRAAIGASKPKGMLRSVAAMPYNLVSGTVKLARMSSGGSLPPSDQDGSLADSWVDFLIQQAQAADAAEEQSRSAAASASGAKPAIPKSPAFVQTPRSPRSALFSSQQQERKT